VSVPLCDGFSFFFCLLTLSKDITSVILSIYATPPSAQNKIIGTGCEGGLHESQTVGKELPHEIRIIIKYSRRTGAIAPARKGESGCWLGGGGVRSAQFCMKSDGCVECMACRATKTF
jgi:hypothetical protein